MKSTIRFMHCLNYFFLICCTLVLFATSLFSQIGGYGILNITNSKGEASVGNPVGKVLFKYLHNGQYLPAGAAIHAIAADTPLSDFLAMDLTLSTGITTLEERFRIMSNGNVGINTSAPNARLEVQHFATPNNLGNTLFQVTGGQKATPSVFSIYNQANNRLQAMLDGYLTVNKGNIILTQGRIMVNTIEPLGNYVGQFNGSVIATEFWVKKYPNWPDYVFTPTYRLMSLTEIDAYTKTHGHLPNIPSAAEVAAGGFSLATMQAKSMEKIEELTLHQIAQEKAHEQYVMETEEKMKAMEQRHQKDMQELKAQVALLSEHLEQLKK